MTIKREHLSMGWIDYCKVYDIMSSPSISKMLNLVKVSSNVQGLLSRSMNNWGIVLMSNSKILDEFEATCSFFYVDGLFPTLFVLGFDPHPLILIKIWDTGRITHIVNDPFNRWIKVAWKITRGVRKVSKAIFWRYVFMKF